MALTELTIINTKSSDKPVKLTDGNGMHHSRKATTYEGSKIFCKRSKDETPTSGSTKHTS